MDTGTIIFFLVANHLLWDWCLQDRREAVLKLVKWKTRLFHSITIGIALMIMLGLLVLKASNLCILGWGIYFTLTHFIIDTPSFKKWWVSKVLSGRDDEENWYWVGLDQAFHFVSFVPVATWLILR